MPHRSIASSRMPLLRTTGAMYAGKTPGNKGGPPCRVSKCPRERDDRGLAFGNAVEVTHRNHASPISIDLELRSWFVP